MSAPVVILVNPQMGENIGAVARAMSNFGMSELRLVAPRDGWPNPKAIEMAAGAESIVTSAKIYTSFAAAMEDVHMAYATTARPRDMEKTVATPQEATEQMAAYIRAGQRCALVFGPERTGLTNDDISLCDVLITIPTSEQNRSLNLAQSSVILGYEWIKASGQSVAEYRALPELAAKEDWLGLFGQLEEYLDASDYFRVEHKKPVMWQNMQNMLMRGQWSQQEIRTLRGALRSLWERRRG